MHFRYKVMREQDVTPEQRPQIEGKLIQFTEQDFKALCSSGMTLIHFKQALLRHKLLLYCYSSPRKPLYAFDDNHKEDDNDENEQTPEDYDYGYEAPLEPVHDYYPPVLEARPSDGFLIAFSSLI